MKNIFVTGANGFLGKYIVEALLEKENYFVFAFGRNREDLIERLPENQRLRLFDNQDWVNSNIPFDEIDVVIHLAFARARTGEKAITKSLLFTSELFKVASTNNLAIINGSTQEVYGENYTTPRVEISETVPTTFYGLAKLSSELILKSYSSSQNISSTNLRLPGLLGIETDSRLVNKFVQNTIDNIPIIITGGSQVFSQLDVRDAADGIISLLKIPPAEWKPVYNLGYLKSYSITEIAETVAKVAINHELPKVEIKIYKTDDVFYVDMDSSLFYLDTNWKPGYDMEAITKNILEYKLGNRLSNAQIK